MTGNPLLIRLTQIGNPIFPTPMKPIFCMCELPCPTGALRNIRGPIREVQSEAHGPYHHGPGLDGECANAVDNEGIVQSDLSRLTFIGGANDCHPVALGAVAE